MARCGGACGRPSQEGHHQVLCKQSAPQARRHGDQEVHGQAGRACRGDLPPPLRALGGQSLRPRGFLGAEKASRRRRLLPQRHPLPPVRCHAGRSGYQRAAAGRGAEREQRADAPRRPGQAGRGGVEDDGGAGCHEGAGVLRHAARAAGRCRAPRPRAARGGGGSGHGNKGTSRGSGRLREIGGKTCANCVHRSGRQTNPGRPRDELAERL
mmetsp:Transcript_5328/g.14839  ORF Transcript_5328/g.14839 Transcript_5328/m.14839 type:complete len:211 (+) Transcript_5328:541-1173(+)